MNVLLFFENHPIIVDLLSPFIVAVASVVIYKSQKKTIDNVKNASISTFKGSVDEMKITYKEGLQASLEVSFNNRFAEIVRKIYRGDQIDHFYGLFWGLQYDQFLQFKKGFISRDMFAYWMYSRLNEFRNVTGNSNFHQLTVNGWTEEKGVYQYLDTDFFQLVEYIKENPQITRQDLNQYINNKFENLAGFKDLR